PAAPCRRRGASAARSPGPAAPPPGTGACRAPQKTAPGIGAGAAGPQPHTPPPTGRGPTPAPCSASQTASFPEPHSHHYQWVVQQGGGDPLPPGTKRGTLAGAPEAYRLTLPRLSQRISRLPMSTRMRISTDSTAADCGEAYELRWNRW